MRNIEDKAIDTQSNLLYSAQIIEDIERETGRVFSCIGIVTAGFHIMRASVLARNFALLRERGVTLIPAYGKNTGADNWYLNPIGRQICLDEIRKMCMVYIRQ